MCGCLRSMSGSRLTSGLTDFPRPNTTLRCHKYRKKLPKVAHNLPDPWHLAVHDTFHLVLNITNTYPVTNLEFDVGEVLGEGEVVALGRPVVEVGAAYRHHGEGEPTVLHLHPGYSHPGEAAPRPPLPRPDGGQAKVQGALAAEHRGHQGRGQGAQQLPPQLELPF